jgi:Thaumatin family
MPALKELTMVHRPSASLVRFVTLSALILGCLMACGGGSGGGAPSGGASSGGGGRDSSPSITCRTDGDGKTTLVFVNGCAHSIEFRGSDFDGGALSPGEFECVDIGSDSEPINSKRYWGYLGEDPGGEHHTLAEFTFNTDFYDFDWYNISHVDAHNLPLQIVPVDRPDCEVLTCAESWLGSCPAEGRLEDARGETVSCVSPSRDDPNSPVAQFFEACDDAYAWSGDDQEGEDPSPMRACAGEDWDIVFCPEAEP